MCNISTRLDSLNHQLMIISKLQKMEEECNIYLNSTCKKCSIYNSGKVCPCAHRILSFKEHCNGFSCGDRCISYDKSKKKIPCNSRTCKTHRKLLFCRNTELPEVQTDLNDNVQTLKSTNTNMRNNTSSYDFLQMKEKQNKSDQVNLSSQLFKTYVSDKIVDTYEEKNEQTIPTKENFHTELNTNNSNVNTVQFELPRKEKVRIEIDKNVIQESNELEEIDYNIEEFPVNDKKIFERIQKDLLNERKRTKELEKKLKSLTCSLNCLKEDSEQKAACLKGALETAEEQAKVAMDLVKQSKDQTDLVKADRDELLNEISKLQQQIIEVAHTNTALLQERDNLKNKLQSLSEDESKRCEEVQKEVNRMKQAVNEKEDALNKERTEFMDMILELTNVIKIQKRRICEVTSICNSQQHTLHEKDKDLCERDKKLSEVENMLQSSNCTCKELEEKIEDLKYCLCEETNACNCLKQELETFKENHSSEIRIKEKIIEEQNKTISKQRMLLHDSEEMAQQVGCEFDQLKEELYEEKQKNKSLQITLDKADHELNRAYLSQCEKCRTLTSEIDYLQKEKQRALTIAKFTYQKLHQSIKEYQNKLMYERQQHRYMVSILQKKEQEMSCLKNQIHQNNAKTIKNMNSYII